MFAHTPLRLAMLAVLLAVAVARALTADYFGLEILAEIAILAILVIALDLVAGFGGMVSLCHGALMGVGAYAFAMATTAHGVPAPMAMAGAVLLSAALAWGVGAVCARAHGIYFIMATLAFGQMAYSLVFESPLFGGDDGLSGVPRLDLTAVGLDLNDGRAFALFCVACAALAYAVAAGVLGSGLGRTLVGVARSERRMAALGLTVWRTKAAVFAVSGALAGLGGALAAQHAMFVSPGLLAWTVSGEALVVVILGGIGTLVGPVVGAVLFVVLKHEISAVTPYWHMAVGLILIAVVAAGGRGVFGSLETLRLRRPQPELQEVQTDA
ncbi:MAG: branched-chain amino acid ABC transporter permease [Rubrimonas sp.]